MPGSPITVLIAGPHAVRRDALSRALRRCELLHIVAVAGDAREAMARIRTRRPAVAVVESDLDGRDGAELARDVREAGLPTRVVLLTHTGGAETLVRGIALGAATAVPAGVGVRELCATVVAVGRGETRLPSVLQEQFVSAVRARWVGEPPSLTTRQQEVLELIADGLTGPQIAERLIVSHATVKTHLEKLYENLGVSDRAAAVAVAMRSGILV